MSQSPSPPPPPPLRRTDAHSLARRLPIQRTDDQPLARKLPVDRPAQAGHGDDAAGREDTGTAATAMAPPRGGTAPERPDAGEQVTAGLPGQPASRSAPSYDGWSRLHSSSLQLNLATVELVVSPFETFVELGRFQQALAGLPGVRAVQPRRLQRGMLQLRVECRASTELLDGLAAHWPSPFRLVSCEPYRVEIALDGHRGPDGHGREDEG